MIGVEAKNKLLEQLVGRWRIIKMLIRVDRASRGVGIHTQGPLLMAHAGAPFFWLFQTVGKGI